MQRYGYNSIVPLVYVESYMDAHACSCTYSLFVVSIKDVGKTCQSPFVKETVLTDGVFFNTAKGMDEGNFTKNTSVGHLRDCM